MEDIVNLGIKIYDKPEYFSLYCDGLDAVQNREKDSSIFLYPNNAIIFLFYTYPSHRRVYCVKNCNSSLMYELPNVNRKTTILFKQFASKVDKTKKAVSFIKEHYPKYVYKYSDVFYYKLDIIIKEKGKLDYYVLDALCKRSIENGCFSNT